MVMQPHEALLLLYASVTRYREYQEHLLNPTGFSPWRFYYTSEDYLGRESNKRTHPAVLRCICTESFQDLEYSAFYEALHALALEWPYVPESTEDKAKVAYTRDPAAGKADRQVVGKLGGYLVRHFPMLAGHTIEKIVGAWRGEVNGENFRVLRTMPEILHAIETTTATSCMCGSAENFDGGIHPYSVYDPALGWGLAVHENINGDFVSRAVVHMGDEHISKRFVRIYSSRADGGYNCDNAAFRDWLENQGFVSRSGFSGGRLKVIRYHDDYIAPYLDGCQGCDLEYRGGGEVFVIGGDEIVFNQTSGLSGDSHSGQVQTDSGDSHSGQVQTDSGDWIDEDEAVSIGDSYYHVDACAQECENDEWILRDNAVRINGDWYSSESENIVILDDGYACHVDDACCLSNGGWELRGDCVETLSGDWFPRLDCRLLQSGAWCPEDDAVQVGGAWYRMDDCVCIDDVWMLEADAETMEIEVNS